ncbi:hypothetical protein JC221_098 [Yersinia phage JC221]|nr:hypothetical protein JC221_098 [Yersinia phage JC221]
MVSVEDRVLVNHLEINMDYMTRFLDRDAGEVYAISVTDDNHKEQKYRFEWPSDAMGNIQSIFVSENKLYASSASVLRQLEAYPIYRGSGFNYKAPVTETTVLIGNINSKSFAFRASKTNLKAL